MKKFIKVTITTKGYGRKDAIVGKFTRGRLYISISNLPEHIYIFLDEPFSANDGEICLRQLREKLNNCEGVTRYDSAIVYHDTSPHECLFGAVQNEYNELNRTILETHYFITYSLYDLI